MSPWPESIVRAALVLTMTMVMVMATVTTTAIMMELIIHSDGFCNSASKA